MYGDEGDDILHGGNGKDYLDGGADNDTMYGDNGSDILFGAVGADHLYGGNAGDTFVYTLTTHSTAGVGGVWSATTGDWIYDFSHNEGDKLDFTQFSGLTGSGGDELTWNGSTAGAHKIWSDGSYVYADTSGDSTADLVIRVNGVGVDDIVGINHAPVTDDETNSINEDTTLTVTAANGVLNGDVDVDGDTLTVTGFTVTGDATVYSAGATATITGKGTLTINADGSYEFVPAANYNGAVPVATYTVSDGHGGTDTGSLTLTVNSVADLTAGNDSNAGNEDTVISGSVAGNNSTTSAAPWPMRSTATAATATP